MKKNLAFYITAITILFAEKTNAQWSTNPAVNNAISVAANNQTIPTIISDGAGGAIITWYDLRGGTTNDIYAQRINAAGVVQWTANGVAICTAADQQYDPTIVSDGAGGAIITWHDFRNGTNYDIYAQRINAMGAVQWTANGVAICTAVNAQGDPTIVSDGAGGAIITWYDYRSGTSYDIYAQCINAAGAVQWTTNGVAICTAANAQYFPTIDSDGTGGAIITWYDLRSGTNNDIYAQRINAAGAVQWTGNGVAICTAAGSQGDPTIVSDGAGGAIITWYDYRSGTSYDIYTQRINAAGAVQWTGNGVAICTAASDQLYPMIVSDGAGGAIITWYDYRSGTSYDIYARRINAAGAVQWTGNGVAICTAASDQTNPTITSDGAGGAIITWQDYRSGTNYQIYTQRINAAGAVQWTANGVAICTAANSQFSPVIVSDGAGGAIIVWQDYRSGTNYDIYAQYVCSGGIIGGTIPVTPGPIGGLTTLCTGMSTNYSITAVPGAISYSWSLPGGWSGSSSTNSISATADATSGTVSVNAANTCGTSTISLVVIAVSPIPTISVNSGSICSGNNFTMIPSGANTYTITGGNAIVSPSINSTYSITGTSTAGCISAGAAISSLAVSPAPTIGVNSGSICSGNNFTITPSGASTYTITGGNAVVSPSVNSTYSITGTSTAGCISAGAAISNITVFLTPTISVSSGSICSGQNFTLNPGGASTYSFSSGSAVVNPLSTASFSISGTSTAGCTSAMAAVANITVNSLPVITVNSGAICAGQSFTLSPTGASTYTYSGGSAIVSPIANNSYSVSGTSTAGCVSVVPAISNVIVNPLPVISVNSGAICPGQSFTMSPNGAATYTYSNGAAVVSPTATTSYSISGTSNAGCVCAAPAISNVTVNALPTITVNNGAICSAQSFTLIPGGASTYTYSGGFAIVNPPNSTTFSITGTSVQGCVSSSPAVSNVTVNPLPLVSVNSGAICSGQSFIMVPGGASTYTYSGGSAIVSPTSNSSYSVTGTSSLGCLSVNTAISNVTVNSLPTILVNSGVICNGKSFTIVPTGANSFTFSNGSSVVSPTSTTSYSVSGTNSLGCVSASPAVSNITVNPLPVLNVGSTSSVICTGEGATLNVGGANTYTWMGGSTGTNVAVSPTVSTMYSVSGDDTNGCRNIASYTLNVSECTGTSQLVVGSRQWAVYPNPNNGEFTIDVPAESEMIVLNSLGQIAIQQHLIEGKNKIDLNERTKGIYFIEVNLNLKITGGKIIKE